MIPGDMIARRGTPGGYGYALRVRGDDAIAAADMRHKRTYH